MQSKHAKMAIGGVWILGLGTIALSATLASVGGWLLLLGWGVIPPLLLMRLRRRQEQSMSESIRDAIR